MRAWIGILLGGLVAGVVACGGGGSGSTGLITSESTVVDDVRESGTCDAFDGVTYCGSDSPDAIAPGGQSVSLVTAAPTPVRTPTSSGASATPAAPTGTVATSPSIAPTSTPTSGGPQNTATPVASPTPAPTATPAAPSTVTVLIDGFAPGAACAAASRPTGGDRAWTTASLVTVAAAGVPTTFPLPADAPPPLDVALTCFDHPPDSLPAELVTLADAAPTVVFVLPSP